MQLRLRLATDDDFRAYFGCEPPEIWTAQVAVRDEKIIGIGGVVYDIKGQATAFLDTTERPSFVLHRAALRFLKTMRKVGEPSIRTACQEGIPRAAAWLTKLGFRKTGEIIDEQEIWLWQP